MDLQINLRYVTAHVILGFFLEFYKYLEIFSVWHNWRDGVEYFDQLEFAWIFVCWSIRFPKTKIIKCIIFALRINKNYVEVAFYVLKCFFFSGLSWWSPEIWPIIDNWLSFCWNKIQCNGNRKVGIWARKKEILTEIWNQTLLYLNKEPWTLEKFTIGLKRFGSIHGCFPPLNNTRRSIESQWRTIVSQEKYSLVLWTKSWCLYGSMCQHVKLDSHCYLWLQIIFAFVPTPQKKRNICWPAKTRL